MRSFAATVLALLGLGLIVLAAIINSHWLGLCALVVVFLAWRLMHAASESVYPSKATGENWKSVSPQLRNSVEFSSASNPERDYDLTAGFVPRRKE